MFCYEKNQDNFSVPKKGFSEVVIIVNVVPDKVNYKVKFTRNSHEYVVNYKDQVERFKKVQAVL